MTSEGSLPGTLVTSSGTGLVATDAGGRLVLKRVLVRVVTGEDRGTERILEGGTMTIGSHADADLVLSDGSVSRYHVELALLTEGVRVRDLSSTNGTFVGSARVESIVVVPAAELKVGRTRIELVPADLPAPDVPSESTRFGAIVGATPAMRRLFGVLERVAPTDAPVLVEGEQGVGKSAIARAIHEASAFAAGPFGVLDLATQLAPGDASKAAAASVGGTLVLDRIDEVTAPVGAELVPLLGRRERGELAVRIVATSRQDLRARVEAGAAPRDLYFHVAAVRVVIPPLRERIEDLPRLVRELTTELGYDDFAFGAAELAPLRAHDFPGNVRELSRILERTLVASRGSVPPSPADDPASGPALDERLAEIPFKDAKEKLVDAFERQYVARLLDRHDGNMSRAAAEAGLDRNYLAKLAKKHDLR